MFHIAVLVKNLGYTFQVVFRIGTTLFAKDNYLYGIVYFLIVFQKKINQDDFKNYRK